MAVSGVDRVVVATDDDRIREHAEGFGAEVVMTSTTCRNGTERCAEAVANLGLSPEIVVPPLPTSSASSRPSPSLSCLNASSVVITFGLEKRIDVALGCRMPEGDPEGATRFEFVAAHGAEHV